MDATTQAIVDLFEDVKVTEYTTPTASAALYMARETAGEYFGHRARNLIDGVVNVTQQTYGWVNYSDSALIDAEPIPFAEKAKFVTELTEHMRSVAVTATLGGASMRLDYAPNLSPHLTKEEIQEEALQWMATTTRNSIQCWVEELPYCSDLPAVATLLKAKGLLE